MIIIIFSLPMVFNVCNTNRPVHSIRVEYIEALFYFILYPCSNFHWSMSSKTWLVCLRCHKHGEVMKLDEYLNDTRCLSTNKNSTSCVNKRFSRFVGIQPKKDIKKNYNTDVNNKINVSLSFFRKFRKQTITRWDDYKIRELFCRRKYWLTG